MPLAADLIARIQSHGPITVAEYMQRCNAHYYATRDPFGMGGDFTTAPEISQIFGELIGAWLADYWLTFPFGPGKGPCLLVELGPGRGTLMKDALRVTRAVQGFQDAITIRLIETSPYLRKVQHQTLNASHPSLSWHDTLDNLPPLPLLLIANEFFDALPIEHYVGSEERKVDYDGSGFIFQPEGAVTRETSTACAAVMTLIATHIQCFGGAALIIDYGYSTGVQSDTLQAVRTHRYANPLEHPGEADITAHVDFNALARASEAIGAYAHGPMEQGTFLKRLGAELRAAALCKSASIPQRKTILSGLERLLAPHTMGTLFKVMAITSTLDRPAGF